MCEDIRTLTDSLGEVQGELENWRDGMPENMQGGNRYDTIDDAAVALEEQIGAIQDACDEIDQIDWPR